VVVAVGALPPRLPFTVAVVALAPAEAAAHQSLGALEPAPAAALARSLAAAAVGALAAVAGARARAAQENALSGLGKVQLIS
jgi:hypothetical protein